MLTGPVADNLVEAVASACRSGLDADALRAAILPRLDQHGMLIGQIAGQLVIRPHEFPAGAIQRLQALRYPS